MESSEDYITVSEAAAILDTDEKTIRAHLRKDIIEGKKVDRLWMIPLREIDRYKSEKEQKEEHRRNGIGRKSEMIFEFVPDHLVEAAELLQQFYNNTHLKDRVSLLEQLFLGEIVGTCSLRLSEHCIDKSLLDAALLFKALVGQIDVVVHTIGILLSLPHILEKDETVLSLSLGAGSSGKDFDLETSKRVAEFKFAQWKGTAETIRKRQVFKDLYHLAEYEGEKQRCLYVLDKQFPIKFLSGNSKTRRILYSKSLIEEFESKYGEAFEFVSQYYGEVGLRVNILDLRDIVPEFRTTDIPADTSRGEMDNA